MIRQLSPYVKVLCSAALLLYALAMPSCGVSDDGVRLPNRGRLVYEVDYSEDIRKLYSIGAFLPNSAFGMYDSTNFKITTSAPLSLAKVALIHSGENNFMSLTFNEMNVFTDFSSLSEDSSFVSRTSDDLKEICGIPSRQTSISLLGEEGSEYRLDVFVAEPDATIKAADENFPTLSASGLVTALSLRHGDSNIIFILKNIEPLESVNPEEFSRPQESIEISAENLVALMQIL